MSEVNKQVEELELEYPSKEFGLVSVSRLWIQLYDDSKYNEEGGWERVVIGIEDRGWTIELLHSCDEWVVGNQEETKKMIKHLQEAVEYCESYA